VISITPGLKSRTTGMYPVVRTFRSPAAKAGFVALCCCFSMMRVFKVVLVGLAILAAAAPTPSHVVERWFSRGWYPAVQPRLTGFSNLVPVALFDVLCAVAVVLLAVSWWVGLRRAPRGTRARAVRRLSLDTVTVASLVYLWFLLAWGLNYRREKLTIRLDFDERRITREALVALASDAARQATLTREAGPRSAPAIEALLDSLARPFAQTLSMLAASPARPARPKWSMLTLMFRRIGVDGMTDPFFLETLVRTDLLPFERPFVVAHEWGHLAGFADEAEASFIAFVTCAQGDADARYSGWLLLYAQVAGELGRADRAVVDPLLGPGPAADLRALAEKTRREILPSARDAGRAAYDRFLKANRLESGVRSYDEVTRLLAGTKLREGLIPVLRASPNVP
jgi:hypothetical protein